jgi:hypothetical protein
MNNKYAGMTVNERLYSSNLDEDFYEAVKRKDFDKIVLILKKVEFNDDAIVPILEYFEITQNEPTRQP